MVASQVHDRFPNYESLVKADLLLPHEKDWLEKVDNRTPHETTYIPISWALNLVLDARASSDPMKKIVAESPIYANLIEAFDYLDGRNRTLLNHGWINFALSYTQVNTQIIIYVYKFFFTDELRNFTISDFPKQRHFGHILITLYFFFTL